MPKRKFTIHKTVPTMHFLHTPDTLLVFDVEDGMLELVDKDPQMTTNTGSACIYLEPDEAEEIAKMLLYYAASNR